MAWIESHQTLWDNVKTRKATRALDITDVELVGHLHSLWHWAIDHAEDGDLSKFDVDDIAIAARWDGDAHEFVEALVGCGPGDDPGFLEPGGPIGDPTEGRVGELVIHDWWEHAGRLIAQRRAAREDGLYGNHVRHHERRGVLAPDCPHCSPPESGPESPPDGEGSREAIGLDENPIGSGSHRTEPNPTEPNPTQPSTTSDEPDVTDEARHLTRYFAQAILDNGHPLPGKGSKARDTWFVEMDRLLRLGPPGEGGHIPDADEVEHVIDFATTDDFWAANIQSVPTFRRKFAQLRLKARSNGTRGSDYAARYEAAAEQLERQGR